MDTVKDVLILCRSLKSMKINKDNMEQSLTNDFSVATELADFLAGRGVPFREAHAVVGRLIRRALESGKSLDEFSDQELSREHPLLSFPEARELLLPRKAVETKKCRGGTAPEAVQEQIRKAREILRKTGLKT